MFSKTQYSKSNGVSTLITKTITGKVTKIETLALVQGTGSYYDYTVQVPGQAPTTKRVDDIEGERIARRFQK